MSLKRDSASYGFFMLKNELHPGEIGFAKFTPAKRHQLPDEKAGLLQNQEGIHL